jgi:hypothetical protein
MQQSVGDIRAQHQVLRAKMDLNAEVDAANAELKAVQEAQPRVPEDVEQASARVEGARAHREELRQRRA